MMKRLYWQMVMMYRAGKLRRARRRGEVRAVIEALEIRFDKAVLKVIKGGY